VVRRRSNVIKLEIGGDPSSFVKLGRFFNLVTERLLNVRWRSGELFNEGNGICGDVWFASYWWLEWVESSCLHWWR
jgi:hypothetical protein